VPVPVQWSDPAQLQTNARKTPALCIGGVHFDSSYEPIKTLNSELYGPMESVRYTAGWRGLIFDHPVELLNIAWIQIPR
jgi:hypothetical protein